MTRDTRHDVITIVERELAKAGCATAATLSRQIVVCIEGAHVAFADTTPAAPRAWQDGAAPADPNGNEEYRQAKQALAEHPVVHKPRTRVPASLGRAPWQA